MSRLLNAVAAGVVFTAVAEDLSSVEISSEAAAIIDQRTEELELASTLARLAALTASTILTDSAGRGMVTSTVVAASTAADVASTVATKPAR